MTEWTEELREICRDACAEYGDPPCWRLPELTSHAAGQTFEPCKECLAARAARLTPTP